MISKKLLGLYGAIFAVGLVNGVLYYIGSRSDHTPAVAQSPVAPANYVHIGIAVVATIAILVAYNIDKRRGSKTVTAADGGPAGFKGFWKMPFTVFFERRLLYAAISLPVVLVEFVLALVGNGKLAAKVEAWHANRVLRANGKTVAPAQGFDGAYVVRQFGRLVASIFATLGAYLILYGFWRGAYQIFGALDPHFVIDAWGGPTYLGASGAHWMDGVLIFYASAAVVRRIARQQSTPAKA